MLSELLEVLKILRLPDFPIECIISFSAGVLVGGPEGKIAALGATDDPSSPYLPPVYLQIPEQFGAVKSISLSVPSEETLIAALDNSQLFSASFNPALLSDPLDFSYLSYSFHSKAITGLDV